MPRRAARFWEPVARLVEADDIADGLLRRLGMLAFGDVVAGTLAHGRQRMLEVGMCLAARPQLLLLDEPTSGMGIDDLPMMRELIRDIARDHTVVLIEHNMSIVLSISDRITVMAHGRILTEGTAQDIQGHPEVRRAYLGAGALA
ncbi:ABC transporter ATP-binding protein C-terminal domain-containing protein [Paraburkholderia aspalathi]|uniref:Branched-chain amino acid transport system ATP-binding protein n=1 Tax=Paraburkholderia aspalathi TaxID=1324617 RepID=A0A1I7EQZ6_9BURK|nr:branched-chain amino acid transport system ATP-binding protein [Paraburkholderia aspalathi]